MFLSDVLGVEVFLLTPTTSGGDDTGPRFCVPLSPSSPSFPPRFLGIALKILDEFPWKSSFRFLFCHLFGPVNHGQDWKGWERSGEKGLIISDNQAQTCLIITINDTSTVRRKWNSPLLVCANWSPETVKKRSVSWWPCKNKRNTNSLCNPPQ